MYFHADIDHAPTSRYIVHDVRARKDALETEHEPKGGLGHGYDLPVKGVIITSSAGMHGGFVSGS